VRQGLRRLVRTRGVSAVRADDVVADLGDLDRCRHAHIDLLDRMWAVQDKVSAYVAMYIAVAGA
jgi:predicted nucleic acid-binding protein